MLFSVLKKFQAETGVELAFQCCEHLNRALVLERETAEKHFLEPVSVVPVVRQAVPWRPMLLNIC